MFRKLPPLHALAAFEAAARLESFAKAAEELHLTHSAVSHRIKQLEQSIGTQLFLRLNRSVVLTSAGATFLETVRDSLHRLEAASGQLSSGGRTLLRVTVAPAFASSWLAQRIAAFQRQHPKIDLEIHSSSQMINLRNQEMDIGLRFGVGHWPGYHCVRLLSDELLPVCSPEYLSTHGPIQSPHDLARLTLLRNTRLPWREWFKAAGLDWDEPTQGPLFHEVSLLIDAAASGAGIALSGRVAATPNLRSGRLVEPLRITAVPNRAYYAVCLPEKLGRTEVAEFLGWLTAQAREDEAASLEATVGAA